MTQENTIKIEKAINELKDMLKPQEKDAAKIRKKLDEVNQIVQAASVELYQKAQQQREGAKGGAGGTGNSDDDNGNKGNGSADDKTVDADYKVEDDENKK